MPTAADPVHRQGLTIDRVDQLSSVTILGFAVIGGLLAMGLLSLIGG